METFDDERARVAYGQQFEGGMRTIDSNYDMSETVNPTALMAIPFDDYTGGDSFENGGLSYGLGGLESLDSGSDLSDLGSGRRQIDSGQARYGFESADEGSQEAVETL